MNGVNSSLTDALRNLASAINQDLASPEAAERAQTAEEQRRVGALRSVLEGIAQALALSNDDAPEPAAAADAVALREGRYAAANAQYQGELRLDTGQHGIVSLDLYLGTTSSRTYLASLRSNPGAIVRPGQHRFGVVGEDEDGNQATGTVEITPMSETQATVGVTLDRGLNSLPVSVPLVMIAVWQSPFFRTIGLEVDAEDGIAPLPSFSADGRAVTLETCFGDAGLEVIAVGRRDSIPKPANGWDDAQLHGLMSRFANEALGQKAWTLHLLLLSRSSTDRRLLGVMFDSGERDENGFPRQGAAVFTEPIRNHRAGFERKLLQTTAHELGHALNLAHRFERVVSRADSTSCMNYDWRYMGGGRDEQFWREFRFGFDPDEVRFLRHGPRGAVIPGGVEFHTVNYWSDGTGGYSPYYQEVALQGLELRLSPPPAGTLFGFAQPVLLALALKNTTGRTVDIPSQFLDPKSGFLEILVRRVGLPGPGNASKQFSFSPLFNRCWDLQDSASDLVPDGGSLTNNLNLTFGSAGFTFAEPGAYEVTAVLSLFDRVRQVDQIVRSNTLRIRIAHPQSLEEEREAIDLMRKDVGYYLTLGGSDVLSKAADTLEEVRQRRQGKSKEVTDPLVANIIRCQAINLSRDFTTYSDGAFHSRPADPPHAADLLGLLTTDRARRFFDPATERGNLNLMKRLREQDGQTAGDQTPSPAAG